MAKQSIAKQLPVRDSNGQFSHRRRAWIAKHEAAGHGAWVGGVFVFHRQEQEIVVVSPAICSRTRAVSLRDRFSDRAVSVEYYDPHGVLRFWGDQSSHGRSQVKRSR